MSNDSPQNPGNPLQCTILPVADELFCVWGFDTIERDLRFIDGIDEGYFEFVSSINHEHLDGPDSRRAAIAIRANYYLSLETFFSLIMSTLQAADCVSGWIMKANNATLRSMVSSVLKGRFSYPACWSNISNSVTFLQISELILYYTKWSQDNSDSTVKEFGTLWTRLASEFIDSYTVDEYNSIKHGFRARSGGFHLSFGEEKEPGKAAATEDMKSLGGSKYGSSFFTLQRISESNKSISHHYRLRNNNINWLPESLVQKTHLVSMSISNIKSFLKIIHGIKPDECRFVRPSEAAAYGEPWTKSVGITSMNFDYTISEQMIVPHSRADLKKLLEQLRSERDPGKS